MRRRPRPHLFTPQARELLGNIALSLGCGLVLLAVKALLDALPFLVGG